MGATKPFPVLFGLVFVAAGAGRAGRGAVRFALSAAARMGYNRDNRQGSDE